MTEQALFTTGQPSPDTLLLQLTGTWTTHSPAPDPAALLHALEDRALQNLDFDCQGLGQWDTRLLIFLKTVIAVARKRQLRIALDHIPAGARRLLELSENVPEQATYSSPPARPSLTTRIGLQTLKIFAACRETATFTGEIILEFFALLRGKSSFRARDFFYFVQACGVESLPIVSLISILVGVILSFVGAVQLQMFGAQIYVANLVALGMVLEMGALMSGVIIAGRIGAAYAAQLGTMQVNEEIDALRTMGISPAGFLILPRMLALMLMLPLLCIYADIMGILGGSIIGSAMLDLSLVEYFEQARKSVSLYQCSQGLLKSSVFGVLIGYAGCLRGMQCGRSALAVGEATTSAVVTSIVLIVVSDSIITVILYG